MKTISAQARTTWLNNHVVVILKTTDNKYYLPGDDIGVVLGLTPENLIKTFQEHLGENIPFKSIKWECLCEKEKQIFDDLPNPTWALSLDSFHELVIGLSEQGNQQAFTILCDLLFFKE